LTALDLIAKLRDLGVQLSLDGDELVLDAPKGVVTAGLAGEIRERKVQIVALLKWSARSKHSSELPLEAVSRDGHLPLSYSQQRLWFLDQLEPDSAAYNISWTVRLRGELNREALQAAVDYVVQRHEVLRSRFVSEGGAAEVVVESNVTVPLEHSVLRGAGDERLRAHLSVLAGSTFKLDEAPLIRVFLVERAADEHVLLVLIHHIISDGASMRILFRELAAAYDAFAAGGRPELPPLELQYADYAAWQRRWLDGEELQRQLDYWSNQLADAPPVLALPSDRPRSAALRFRGASVVRLLPRSLAEELRGLARTSGATLFMVMFAAFDVLLQRYSGQRDLVVGTPIGGRPRTALEGLIGFFVNTAVIRVQLEEGLTFRNLLRQVRDTALDMHTHQELPFEKLVEVIQPQRELSHTPVFQVMFDLQEEPRWKLPVRNLEVIPEVIFSSRTSTFDLTLSVREAENGLDAMFEYDTDLFDEATIERMAEHYQNLLEAALNDPDCPVDQLPMLSASEREQLLGSDVRPDQPRTLQSLLQDAVDAAPDRIALTSADGRSDGKVDGLSLSYKELNELSDRIAAGLMQRGVQKGQAVGLLARRGVKTVAAQLGILKTGAVWVPLDPDFPGERLLQMVEQVQPAVVLAVACEEYPAFACDLLSVDELAIDDVAQADIATLPVVDLRTDPDAVACILFTSGSTGQPKGVRLTHAGLSNYIIALRDKTGLDGGRVLQFASLNFDISIEETFVAFASASTLVLRDNEAVPSAHEFLQLLAEQQISWTSLPTAYWHELAGSLDAATVIPECLNTVIIGGEKAQLSLWQRWQQQVSSASSVQLINTYGPTETSIVATWCDITHLNPEGLHDIPIGTPVPNVQAYVLDAHEQLQPTGVPGELAIGGAGVAAGYLHESGSFSRNPYAVGRWYKTGDRVRRLQDGSLEYLGRIDEQLKLRGHRVEPAEVEAALLRESGVDAATVVPVKTGADTLLVAYVAGDVTVAALRSGLQNVLPDYMVPDAFVVLDGLPLTVNGKVDRAALPAPENLRSASAEYRAPESETEKTIAAVWAEVLGLQRVGLDDDFFQLGGHSLLATRVIARLRDALGVNLPLRQLFNNPTVAGLAGVAGQQAGTSALPPVVPRKTQELPPLSYAQQRLWFLDQLSPGTPTFNLPWMARLRGDLKRDALQAACNQLLARHESLRTTFIASGESQVQVIAPAAAVSIETVEMPAATVAELQQRIQVFTSAGFDLQSGPLFRVVLLEVAPDDHVLLLLLHHIIADGWSMGVLYRELSLLYNAAAADAGAKLPKLSVLPGLAVQYADYAIWQREFLQGEELQRQLNYWQSQLTNLPPLLELHSDYERPPVQSYSGDWADLQLDAGLSQQLQQLAAEQGCSLFMLLLAVFKVLLGRYAGREDMVVGTPVAGRQRTELEGLVGFFLNTLVLRTDLGGNPSFTELLDRVRRVSLDAFDHQDLPFESLIEAVQPERNAAYPPLVQVMFNVHNEPAANVRFDGVDVAPFSLASGTAKFDLNIAVHERNDGLLLGIEFATDLFARSSIERMLSEYQALLTAVVSNPQQRLADLPLPGGRESAGVVTFGGRDTANRRIENGELVGWDNVLTRITAQISRRPMEVAVDDGETRLTYAQLLPDVSVLQTALPERAADREESLRVALLCSHDASAITGIMSALRLGVTWVALDPNQPQQRLQQIVDEADVAAVFFGPGHAQLAAALHAKVAALPAPKDIHADGWASEWQLIEKSLNKQSVAKPDDLAYILFTSGTTGKPKGVPQTHENALAHADIYSESLYIAENDRLSLLSSIGFDAAIMDVLAALSNGACLCPLDLSKHSDPLQTLIDRGISVLHATPTVFRLLMSSPAELPVRLRALVLGGEAAVRDDFDLFRNRFAAGAVFINGLGPSESTTALQFIADTDATAGAGPLPVGRAVADTTVWLEGPDGQRSAFCGEMIIASDRLAPGYWSNPELTAAKFVEKAGVRTYRSGDLARYLPNGNLVFSGRRDGQIKIHGQRIETAEVEHALNRCAGVQRSVVSLSSSGEQLLAWYTSAEQLDQTELRNELRTLLPAAMVPVYFCHVDDFPLLANGKLDYGVLNALAAESGAQTSQPVFREPSGQTEQCIAAIWHGLLGVQAGRDDDFFAIGGHSLLATRVAAKLREQLGVAVTLRMLFDHPVLEDLARVVSAEGTDASLPLTRLCDADRRITPLSWSQQRLWFLDQLDPGNAAYNLHRAIEVKGGLDCRCLQTAIDRLVARHAALHTVFASQGGEPVQILMPQLQVPLEQISLSGATHEQVRERLLTIVREPFDLQLGPLLRVIWVSTGSSADGPDATGVLLLLMHHIISDGWSMGIISRELGALYKETLDQEVLHQEALHQEALHQTAAELPLLPVQYPDYAVWQRNWLQGEELERQTVYWREQLAEVPPLLELPLDRPRPVVPSNRGAWRQLYLSKELQQQLNRFSSDRGVTLFMTLLAAFNVLLARYTGREDIVVGTPVAGRNRAEIENVVGFFLNTLVMRTSLSADPSFDDILVRTRETALGAFDHQDLPFEKLLEELQPARSLSTSPLVQVMFNLHNEEESRLELGDETSVFHLDRGTAKLDISLAVTEGQEGLLVAAEYNSDIFNPETVDALLERYGELIEQLIAQPARPLSQLLSQSLSQLTSASMTTATDSDEFTAADGSIVSVFAQRVAERPEALAVNTGPAETGGQQWSYAELDGRSDQVAADLLDRITPQDRVGLMLGHDAAMLAGLLGALKAGCCYVPLDPEAPGARLSEIAADAELSAIVTSTANKDAAATFAAELQLPLIHVSDDVPDATAPKPVVDIDPGHPAYILFTSGSTGKPKGVVQTHANLLQHAAVYSNSLGLTADDCLSLLSPYGFDAAVMDIYAALYSGACLRPFDLRNEAYVGAVIGEIAGSGITVLHATPTVFRYLMRHKICRHDVTKVRAVVMGGEEAKLGDFEFFKKNFDEQAVFVNGLGPSECTLALQWSGGHDAVLPGGVVPVGRPVQGVAVCLLDATQKRSAISGEIAISCAAVTPGYWQRPDLTEHAFVELDGKRWYRTGDRGRYLPDGTIVFAGRVDEQIKLRGHRIEPAEIESVLLSHERVDRAVVLLRDDLQGNPRLVAWVVAKKKQQVEAAELRELLKQHLPRYMLPSAVEVVEGLPLTVNGKVNRKALPDPVWGRNEDLVYVAPRTDTETRVSQIWAEVLGVPKVGVNDDFFDLGGHSLLAMQLMARIGDSLQVGLPLRRLFDGPTVAEVAKAIDDVRWAAEP